MTALLKPTSPCHGDINRAFYLKLKNPQLPAQKPNRLSKLQWKNQTRDSRLLSACKLRNGALFVASKQRTTRCMIPEDMAREWYKLHPFDKVHECKTQHESVNEICYNFYGYYRPTTAELWNEWPCTKSNSKPPPPTPKGTIKQHVHVTAFGSVSHERRLGAIGSFNTFDGKVMRYNFHSFHACVTLRGFFRHVLLLFRRRLCLTLLTLIATKRNACFP